MIQTAQFSSLRPRERLLDFGVQHLSDAELLALFLGAGLPGASAVELCGELLTSFGSLRKIISAERRTLLRQRAIGPARYAKIRAALEIARRVHQAPLHLVPVTEDGRSLRAFLLAQLRDFPYEVLCCLYLDAGNRLVACENHFRGTVDRVHGHPREIVRRALHHGTPGVITARNQPYGIAELTPLDRELARRLGGALATVDCRLIDHIVVGDGEFLSLQDLPDSASTVRSIDDERPAMGRQLTLSLSEARPDAHVP